MPCTARKTMSMIGLTLTAHVMLITPTTTQPVMNTGFGWKMSERRPPKS